MTGQASVGTAAPGVRVSMYREAVTAMLQAGLVCPRCGAANRPTATHIEIDQSYARAFCRVCALEGLLQIFKPKEPDR